MPSLTPEQIARLYALKQPKPASKQSVRMKTKRLLRQGKLEYKDRCERCGLHEDFSLYPLEVHHRNYDDPTDIEFLCIWCHRKDSAKNRQQNRV